MSKRFCLLTALFVVFWPAISWAQRSATFGKDWVESHPFMITGWASAVTDTGLFDGSGLNVVMSGSGGPISQAASNMIPWIYMANYSAAEGAGWRHNALNQLAKPNNMGVGWLMDDEPTHAQFAELADFADWLRDPANGTSDMLISGSLWDSTLYPRPELYWGGPGNPSYTYEQYIDDWATTVRPDVLSYSAYPYLGNYAQYPSTGVAPGNLETHFNTLMRVRQKGLEHDLPCQVWVRAEKYRNGTGDSELRMQLFSALTTGHKGLYYFQYEHRNSEAYLVNYGDINDPADDTPNELYPIAAAANEEVSNLGDSLRFLKSKSVYFVPKGTHTVTPSRIPNYTSGVQQSQMTDVDITSPAGRFTDGMIGYFKDHNNEDYFMLTNLNFDANDSASDAVDFQIQFDSSVNSLLRLNRETGLDEVVPLANHRLNVTLPGGTGDLFKYNTGNGFVREAGPPAPPPPPPPPGLLFGDNFESYIGRFTNGWPERFNQDPGYAASGWQTYTYNGSAEADSVTIINDGGMTIASGPTPGTAPGGYQDNQGFSNVGGGTPHGHAAQLPQLDPDTTLEFSTMINMATAQTPTYLYLGSDYLAGGSGATDDKIWLELFDDDHSGLAGKARLEYSVDGAGAGATFNLWNWATVGWSEVKLAVDLDAGGNPTEARALYRETPDEGEWTLGATLSPGPLDIDLTHVAVGPGLYATLDNLWITGPAPGIAGDFNADGTVDAADYTVYRDNLGGDSAVLNGNGAGGTTVRHADYALWKQNFGTSGTGSSAAVPEPASLVLMLLVGHAAFALRHRSMS